MPAKNIYHDAVVVALKADGWTITADPLTLTIGDRNLFIDLGVERGELAAEKGGERIAVEVQTFPSLSVVSDLQEAIGQYVLYRSVLSRQQPDRPTALPGRAPESVRWHPVGTARADRDGRPERPAPRLRPRPPGGGAMDKLVRYREIIRRVLDDYATWKPSSPQVTSEVIFDPALDHFELKYLGWDGHRRVHSWVVALLQ